MSDFELADDFLPVYDIGDAVATVADADRQTAWRALLDVDLLNVGREAPAASSRRAGRSAGGRARVRRDARRVVALAAAAAASTVAVARAVVSGRRPSAPFGTAALVLYALVIRPWHLRWGG